MQQTDLEPLKSNWFAMLPNLNVRSLTKRNQLVSIRAAHDMQLFSFAVREVTCACEAFADPLKRVLKDEYLVRLEIIAMMHRTARESDIKRQAIRIACAG